MTRTYVPVRERAARALPDDPADIPPAPGGIVEFAQRLAKAGALPLELTAAQRDCLEMFDGGRAPLTGVDLAIATRRAGRRYLRTLIVAHAIVTGQEVTVAGGDAEQVMAEAMILADLGRGPTSVILDEG